LVKIYQGIHQVKVFQLLVPFAF